MKKISVLLLGLVAVLMSSCYSHRVIGYLQEPTKGNKLPVYDSVSYEPYRIRVNDEIIYRLITMYGTYSKMLEQIIYQVVNTLTHTAYKRTERWICRS